MEPIIDTKFAYLAGSCPKYLKDSQFFLITFETYTVSTCSYTEQKTNFGAASWECRDNGQTIKVYFKIFD